MHPPCSGGLSVYADKICQLHAKRGHNVEAWTTLEDERPRMEVRHGYLVRRYRPFFTVFENPLTLSILPNLLRYARTKFDLIVAHSHLVFTTQFAMLKASLSQRPLVLVSHGYQVHRGRFFDLAESAYLTTAARKVARTSRCIITMTGGEAKRFIRLGIPSQKIVVIPSGVDSVLFHPDNAESSTSQIVWTGRFVREKNLELLIRSFASLKERQCDARLVLAGDGPERPRLMKLSARLGLRDHVRFPGFLPATAIVTLLQKAAIYVLPSTAEALPLSILEAMSSGVPVVIPKGLGLEEVIDDSGISVEQNSPEKWSEAFEMLLTDHDLRCKMAKRARELAISRYSWESVAFRLEKLFTFIDAGQYPPYDIG